MTTTTLSTAASSAPPKAQAETSTVAIIPLIVCFAVGLLMWFCPHPEGITDQGWHALSLFVVTILALIIQPLPMGATALLAVVIGILTKVFTMKQAFAGFSSDVVWLVVFALFIAKGFNVTGLSTRIAYFFTAVFGKKTLGLSYGLMFTDLILSPAIPSVTGRSSGIVYPILQSIANSYQSFPNSDSARKVGAFLIVTAFQVTVITSTMFMTAMAANPILATLTGGTGLEQLNGIDLTWGLWALAAIVPGIVSLGVIPLFIYLIYPPEIKETPSARAHALEKLKAMGSIKPREWIMAFTVVVLLVLWIFGKTLGIEAAVAAMIGLSILLLTGVLEWNSLVKIDNAWETFIWFCVLIMLAGLLKDYQVLSWFTDNVQTHFSAFHWSIAFPVLALMYFYSHYFFASSTAHVTSMYPAFLGLSIVLGTPPLLAVLVLIYFSNLFGGLTHYSLGPAPLLYGVGYVSIKDWWKIGLYTSIINIAIWSTIGLAWWKFLGFW